jgi:hypothetical protein
MLSLLLTLSLIAASRSDATAVYAQQVQATLTQMAIQASDSISFFRVAAFGLPAASVPAATDKQQ